MIAFRQSGNSSVNPKKLLSCGALALGTLIFVTGAGFVVAYISEAIIARLGEPDQSLLFWYLPLLFIGIAGVGLGIGAGVLGLVGLRRLRGPDARIQTQASEKPEDR